MNKTHKLKTWPEYFSAVADGTKTFEIRENDREYKVGDTLVLQEYNNHTEKYSYREIECVVTYMIEGGKFGISKTHCVMAIEVITTYNF